MKPTQLITAFLLLTAIWAHAQTENWQWATSAPNANGIGVVDANGNEYVTGSFSGSTIIFGNDTLVNNNTTGNTHAIFLVKYDASGNVIWARSAGGTGDDLGTAIAVDVNGNIYIAGLIAGIIESDSLIFGTNIVIDSPAYSMVIAKYDPSGNFIWATIPNGTGNNAGGYINGLSTDASGNIFATGYFGGSALFFGADTLINGGEYNAFVVKYDSSANVIWANGFGGDSIAHGDAITTDAAGNFYVTGYFTSPSVTIGTTTLTRQGGANTFVIKYNPAGNVVWAKSAEGNLSDISANAIGTDGKGNVYVSGDFASETLIFGNDTLLSESTVYEVFIVKYDSSGNVLWAKSTGKAGSNLSNGMSTDASGNCYLTGNFNSPELVIGQDTLVNTYGYNSFDVFIAKYDSSGNAVWATSAGGIMNDFGTSLSADNNGNAYVTGFFYSPVFVLGADTLINNNTNDPAMYLAKYGPTTTGIKNVAAANTITVYPNPSAGQFYFKGINSGSTLEVYDVLGQNIFSTIISPSVGGKGEENYLLNISNQAKGVYFYRVVNNGDPVQSGEVVLQ